MTVIRRTPQKCGDRPALRLGQPGQLRLSPRACFPVPASARRGGGPDQGQDAVGDLGGEGDQGSRTDHALSGDDRVEHALQVGVGAGHHAAEHVARAGDGVRLEHLGDGGEPFRYGIVAAGLADLQGDERGHLVAERGRVHVGSVSGDHAAFGHPFQACLNGAAGDTQAPGGLEHPHPGLGG